MVGVVEAEDGMGHLDLVEDTAEVTALEVARILIGGIKFMFKWAPGICRFSRR